VLILPLAAMAAPPAEQDSSYTFIEESHGCRFYSRPQTEKGAVPVYATCTWTGQAAHFDRFLLDLDGQKERYQSLSSLEVIWERGGSMAIHQVHTHSLISPREGLIVFTREVSEGRFVHRYSLAPEQPEPSDGHVTIEVHEGHWSFQESTEGVLEVEYQAAYLPGGSVPPFLVRSFQTGEIVGSVGEVRRAFQKSVPQPAPSRGHTDGQEAQ
jgi:hypothetical protein